MFVTPKYKSDNYRFSPSKANSGPWAVEIGDVLLEAIAGNLDPMGVFSVFLIPSHIKCREGTPFFSTNLP